jgi:hypothetical protein
LHALIFVFFLCLSAPPSNAAELKENTVAAFDTYVKATEARMVGELHPGGAFLYPDRLPTQNRNLIYEQLLGGEIVVSHLETTLEGKRISIPDGIVHHWVGMAFIPNSKLTSVLQVAQDYDHRAELYKPDVIAAKLIWHQGNDYKIFMRLYQTKFTTLVLNTEYQIHWSEIDSNHIYCNSYSTKIAEAVDPSKPDGPELPVGNDHGYLWRLYTYWRFAEKEGGVYVQCETISLTRDIPYGLGWLLRPLVTSIPKQSLNRVLGQTRTLVNERHQTSTLGAADSKN